MALSNHQPFHTGFLQFPCVSPCNNRLSDMVDGRRGLSGQVFPQIKHAQFSGKADVLWPPHKELLKCLLSSSSSDSLGLQGSQQIVIAFCISVSIRPPVHVMCNIDERKNRSPSFSDLEDILSKSLAGHACALGNSFESWKGLSL